MRAGKCWAVAGPAFIGLLGLVLSAPAHAQDAPLSVTYGPEASAAEGDPDHREIVFLSVPHELRDQLYLRVFDPDTGGDHDLLYGAAEDAETRFTLFGGAGAYTDATASAGLEPRPEQPAAGEPLAERRVAAGAALDNSWATLTSFAPEQGERVGDRHYFRLLVEGIAGDDANLYSVTLSLRDRRNLAPEGLEIFSFAPTVRVPDDRRFVELRFTPPPDAERLVLRSFDAARAEVQLTTGFRSLPAAASGQDEWRESEVRLQEDERGRPAAVVFRGGEEQPNDVTFAVLAAGRPLPIALPARAWQPNRRPLPEADIAPLANCFSVAFDASRSSDPDGDQLSYAWRFGDGATGTGHALVHRYAGPGLYRAVLQVVDSSGQVGNGAERAFDVFVKRPPVAAAGSDQVVAPGEAVAFDGSRSRPGIGRSRAIFGTSTTARAARGARLRTSSSGPAITS